MVQQTLQQPLAPSTNSSHKRDCRILLSFPPDPLQLKRAIQNVVQKNDVLPHEPTRCNNVRQRETTKQVNISVVRRRTRIHDAQIAVVSQKKDIQRWRSQQILYTEVCRQPATSADMQGHADVVLLVHEKCWTRPRIPSHCFEYKSPQLHEQVGNNRYRARS